MLAALRWLRRAFFAGSLVLSIGLGWVAFYLEQEMENNLFLTTLSYLPIWVPLLPLLAMTPLALFLSRLSAIILTVSGACYVFMHVLPQHGSGPMARTAPMTELDSFRVMSFNAGQSHRVDFAALIKEMQPDIILLQEARGWLRGKDLIPEMVQFPFREEKGEFAILSKHPLQESGPPVVNILTHDHHKPCAYRHRLFVYGRRVTVFNVHMPSPRDLLKWNAGGACLLGLVNWMSPGISAMHRERTLPWRDRAFALEQLATVVEKEPNLAVVGGDLNCPPWGGGYLALRRTLKDCFSEAGHGFGASFPADTSRLPDFVAPWVRLDHLFVSNEAHVSRWFTTRSGQMQHLPVCAEIIPQH
jgi:hypothetical protein